MAEPICYFCNAVPQGYRLIYGGVVYVFNMLGKFVQTEPLQPFNMQGAVQANVLSLLKSTSSSFEIGISINNQFRVFEISDYAFECYIDDIYRFGGMVAVLTRPLRIGTTARTQNLFVYPNGYDIVSFLTSLNGSKGLNWRLVK